MKNLILYLFLLGPSFVFAQFGIKAGFNWVNVTDAEDVNNDATSGWHAGIFIAGSYKTVLANRTELVYSKQGYDYHTATNTGTVNLEYLTWPQYLAINITKFVQVHAGMQLAYLLSAKVDSTTTTGDPATDDIINIMNRFDYGLGGGLEVHPLQSLVVGARINVGLTSLYKIPEEGEEISFVPTVDLKSNLFQLYAGYKFGKKEAKE